MNCYVFDGLSFREADLWIHNFAKVEDLRETDLANLLDCAPEILSRYQGTFALEHRGEKIVWYDYESLTWSLGEVLRQILKHEPRLRQSKVIWPRIEALCLDTRYGKGRQSLTMLMGHYGGPERIPTLMKLLSDDVHGHALYAQRHLSAEGAEKQAESLLHSPKSWIRQEAKKYLAKIDRKKQKLKARK